MRLLGTKVAVRQEVSAPQTPGGIVLTTQQKLPQGEVVAVGPGAPNHAGASIPLGVEVGDHVLFNNFAVQAVTVDGVDLAIIDVTDIQVIL